VPPALQGKRLVSLDLASMLAGARIRGEFEERLKSALALIATSKGEFVLLIDELHMIVGTGGGDGGMDVSNMLKPMLARGELRLVGASTPDEYRKHVEKDAALERQFQPVYVEPPSARDTVEILRGLRERHEVFHGVRICDSAIEAAVALSDRYVPGRELPDKAVDLIDEAASRLRIGIESPPSDLDQVTQSARRVWPTATGRSARSCSSARPAWARPSWPGRWRSSCSTTSGPWSASTWANTRSGTPCPG